MRLLTLAPLRLEARAMNVGDPRGRVVRTGAGPRRAAAAAAALRAGPAPAAVAVAGVAGALVPGIPAGTRIVGDRVVSADGTPLGEPLLSAPLIAAALRRRGLPVRVGPVVSADRIVRGVVARARLAASGALAVDMETAALLAEPWGCPVAVVRAVADTPEREIRSVATLAGGRRALAALRAAAPALLEWASAVGQRTVVLAGPRSFCAGVERAIETVERAIDQFGTPVYVRRQIVHNRHVVEDLQARGAVFVRELEEVPDGAAVVFSAHGVAPAVRDDAARRGLQVVDATCPLVSKVHHEVRRFRQRGYQVVLIGHPDHDETAGTLGEADDIALLSGPGDVERLHVDDPDRLAYVTQTTLAPADVTEVVGALRRRFPKVIGPNAADVCYATQNRQDAIVAIAGDCDVILVVGSANSSNTARLVEVATRAGCRTFMLDDDAGIQLEWLRGAKTVGVTAGASAPPVLVDRVVDAVRGLGPVEVVEKPVRVETVNFPLPMEVR